MQKFVFPRKRPTVGKATVALDSKSIGELHGLLRKLKLEVETRDLVRKELGASTTRAIQAFQERVGLPPAQGKLTRKTVALMNAEMEHAFVADSKTRTQRLQEMLQKAGMSIDPDEIQSRKFGRSTEQALTQYQGKAGLPQDGRISEALVDRLREDALESRWSSKTQVAQMHRTLLRALRIAKLEEAQIAPDELKGHELGPSTQAAIGAIQKKYGLAATGKLDAATYDRLVSIASSIAQPVKLLKPKAAAELKPIQRAARLNMKGRHVAEAQSALAFLGYPVEETEFKREAFGGSTRVVVLNYQRARGLAMTGHVDRETRESINREVRRANPQAASTEHSYRIRGSVRNDVWQGLGGLKVQVWENLITGQGAMLAERRSAANGFFDVPYDAPRDAATRQVKKPFHLQVKVLDATQRELGSKLLFNPTRITWVNFTQGDQPYRGTSEFQARSALVSKAVSPGTIAALVETGQQRQISQAAQAAGLSLDGVMRLVLAYRVAAALSHPRLGAEACYAYIGQNLPPSLTGDLIASMEDWTLIEQLVDRTATGLVFMDTDLQALAFENAVTANLMPIAVGRQKALVVAALAQLKQTYALEKPILIGNGSLKGLLEATTVDQPHYGAVAAAFLQHRSLGTAFWTDLNARPDDFGGAAAVQDFQATVEVGHVTRNFGPMVALLKQKIDDPAVPDITSPRDLAKLTPERWVSLIHDNGGEVPPGTEGATQLDRVRTYAATLASQSELLFPAIALAATVARSTSNPLPHVAIIQELLDAHPQLDLRATNLDVFVNEQAITLDAETLSEARVLQRVHRIAPTALAGQALLDKRIHSSSQIVAMGKARFAKLLTDTNLVDERTALTMYGMAEYQYARVLQRLTEYRFDLHRADPKAIVKHTYAKADLPPALAGIPDLETLFGSLDFCACSHCQSVYGPAAYLADVLRYLASHDSEVAGKTVQTILFERRPDIGNIKLSCENTETPLPYIDLVCEVLENAVPAPAPSPGFSFQTTLTAAELRASPEHVREEAYDVLRDADYPMDVTFDLRQEEARMFLRHLGVARWELMEAFQPKPPGEPLSPTDVSIAGEYWGMSSHQTAIVTTPEATSARQTLYWGFDATGTHCIVADFMRRSRLGYEQLLELLDVRWVNPPTAANPMDIERPGATCNTEEQKLVNLTVARLDRMHRFLRLWRHTGWAMWELDLLLRAGAIGNRRIDGDTLVRLKQTKQLQERLGLTVEQALSLYGDINTESRVKVDEPQRAIQPLYANVFLNPGVITPVDPGFTLPLSGGNHLSDHKATLLAAFALTEPDLALLLIKIGDDRLTISNLSRLSRYACLARALAVPVKDLLTLEALSGAVDIFGGPRATLDFIELVDWVSRSGFAVDELDYLLSHQPDSPYGLRDDVITEHATALREALRSNASSTPDGTITSQAATAFALPPEQAQLLLTRLRLGGTTLLAHLSIASLIARDADGAYTTPMTPADFPGVYSSYRLLHKAALLLTRLKVTTANLEWLLANFAAFTLLDLGALPVTDVPAAALFPAWLALYKWLYVDGLFPQPEGISLRAVFDKAGVAATPAADVREAIARLMPWKTQDLDDLAARLALQHGGAVSDYGRIETYLRLARCFDQIKRVGAGAAMLLLWAQRDPHPSDTADAQRARALRVAQQIRQAAKSKYDLSVWLAKVTPLEDTLREKKRDALISYLVETSLRSAAPEITFNSKRYGNPAWWRDADDLLSYFLIDVQMSACQMTSRIKQAMSSVQMFVQRCLLGLEQPYVEVSRSEQLDTVSENSWKQWKWMKSYRVWEANRKVFLYPENWIEPELRDDKSPFFEELEAEIMQNDITSENVEAAFRNYVRKVHEVSRLDIVGTCYELDDTDPRDGLPPDINRLHVIGRTRAHPAIYYYRTFDLNYGEWTVWERIDVDIQSDQVTPVVYNRKLYLFWLSFIEKPQKVKKQPPAVASNEPRDTPEPPNQLEIQLARSTRKDRGWTAKQVSKEKLIHPWQRPLHSYNLKPRYKSRENLLWLDVYISQSEEFNNTRFWDAYSNSPQFVTTFRYDERSTPWHSSSFVFDGDVVDAKMQGLPGQYHLLGANGLFNNIPTLTTSYDYVHDSFGADGRAISRLTGPYEIAPRLPLPAGMHYHSTRLVNDKKTLNPNRANVLENEQTRTLLNGAISPFEIVHSQHRITFDTAAGGPVPFFYQDSVRAFFIKPEWQEIFVGYNPAFPAPNYSVYPFYHPYAALFLRELNRSGLDGLLNRRIQTVPESYYPGNSFAFSSYAPAPMTVADATAARDVVDFERYGAYAIYNWEIFFHAPLMIACKLSANQRHDEAMRWFHYIFDPTNAESPDVPQRYWITRPFFEQNSDAYRRQRIEVLLRNIDQHLDALTAWKNNPFKPHLIARYRPVAYQKAVVMKYIDNLIDWADQLFRRDTIEAINEATMLYVLAYELLGRRPVKVPNVEHADRSYNELTVGGGLDPFGNKRVEVLMENFTGAPLRVTRKRAGTEPLPNLDVFYFSIPHNDQLLGYWSKVEGQLFKIRHCMNIAGVVRQLPLFEPPIDPALLVKAAAAGVDLSSVLDDMAAAPSPYRCQRLSQKALELCGEVRALGDKLLAALEKYDAEGMALLRSTHEVTLYQAVRAVRKLQIKEAAEAQASLEKSRETAEQRKLYYESREFMSGWEITALALGGVSATAQTAIALGYMFAGGLAFIPSFVVGAAGFGGSPEVTATPADGARFSKAAECAVSTLGAIATAADKIGSLASTVGGYQRRQDDWTFQGQQATSEIAQLEKQIAAARVRLAIAEKELDNHELQVEQSQAVDAYMRDKYTSQQLYDWHARQMASLYFQSYKLAYDMAKRAEKSFQYEIGDPAATFVQFGYWDSLKKGLLAGERLASDLRRLEAAYLDRNTRDLEITKHISLGQFLPLSLMALKEADSCTVLLPEWLFDMDYPGHFRRRLKTVSISIPCVVGPYTSVNCTLSLTRHAIRMTTDVAAGYGDPLAGGDTRFYSSPVPMTAIATSHGQNDSGMFELSFNDERFLPFEGAGAVSEWRLDLPKENNQFDLATIADVIFHVRYTAKAGDDDLAAAAKTHVAAVLPSQGLRLLALNRELSTEWHRFLHPDGGADQTLSFTLGLEHLPFYARGKTHINLTTVDLIVESPETGSFDVALKVPGAATASDGALDPNPAYGNRQHLARSGFPAIAPLLGQWEIKIRKSADETFRSLRPEDIQNAYMVLGFKTS